MNICKKHLEEAVTFNFVAFSDLEPGDVLEIVENDPNDVTAACCECSNEASEQQAVNLDRATFLAEILITAVETGIDYWADISEYHWHDDGEHTRATAKVKPSEANGPAAWHSLTVETIEKGIAKVKEPGFQINDTLRRDILGGDTDNEAGLIDADGADVIVQAALFGEIVYG
jgi:hypothetical protein